MATTTTFKEVNRKQAFNRLVHEVLLQPSKPYNHLEFYMDDLMEYLRPEMNRMLRAKARGIQFWWSVQVKYSTPLMMTVDYHDEENWFRCHDDDDDDDDEDDETTVYLHSGKLQFLNREKMAGKREEQRQIILARNSGSIRGKSNVVIESIGDVGFKSVNNAKKIE